MINQPGGRFRSLIDIAAGLAIVTMAVVVVWRNFFAAPPQPPQSIKNIKGAVDPIPADPLSLENIVCKG